MSAFCSDLCKSISSCCYDFYHAPFTKKNLLIGGGVLLGLIILIIIIVCAAGGGSSAPTTGADVIRRVPLIDGGNSFMQNLKFHFMDKISDMKLNSDLSEYLKGASCISCQTDLFRLKKGFVGTQVFSVTTNCNSKNKDAVAQTLEQIDLLKRIIADPDNEMTLVKESHDIEKAFSSKKTGVLISVWGSHNIDSRLAVLRMYYDLGVRIVSLAGYNIFDKTVCYPPWIENTGVKDFGKKVVGEMNRLGMIIDLTGCSDAVIQNVASWTTAPVIFSHSTLATTIPTLNVNEGVLQSINKTVMGLVMVPFSPEQICGDKTSECTQTNIADNLDAVVKAVTIDKVGIGSNFDNMEKTPKGVDDVSKFPALFDFLMKRSDGGKHKWNSNELRKLASENFINVFKAVEKQAAALKNKKSKADESIAPKDEFDGGVTQCYSDEDIRFKDHPTPPPSTTTTPTTPTTASTTINTKSPNSTG